MLSRSTEALEHVDLPRSRSSAPELGSLEAHQIPEFRSHVAVSFRRFLHYVESVLKVLSTGFIPCNYFGVLLRSTVRWDDYATA